MTWDCNNLILVTLYMRWFPICPKSHCEFFYNLQEQWPLLCVCKVNLKKLSWISSKVKKFLIRLFDITSKMYRCPGGRTGSSTCVEEEICDES